MNLYAMYFSPTGGTEKIVKKIAVQIGEAKNIPVGIIDFTLPKAREKEYMFSANDLVVFGLPVYAGRVPNVLLNFLSSIKAQGTLLVPVVLYGNRNYDDALMELKILLETNGFKTIGAGAFVGEHSFSKTLAKGRPDEKDLELANSLAEKIIEKLNIEEITPIRVKGNVPIRPYYIPKSREGNSVDIRKVKPIVSDECIECGLCAEVCPMGSIDRENVKEYVGICIKCNACVKKCPIEARYYDDFGYLYHKKELEEEFARRGDIDIFV